MIGRSRANTGFTLVELLIVVVVIGIMTSVSAPTFRGYMMNQKLSAATRELITNLRYARLRAVDERNPWVVMFQAAQRQYIVFADDGGGGGVSTNANFIEENRGNLTPNPGERVLGPFTLTDGVLFGYVTADNLPDGISTNTPISFGGSPPRIVFYPNGSCRETGVIMIQLSERIRENDALGQRAVVLYRPTGAAKALTWNASGTPAWK